MSQSHSLMNTASDPGFVAARGEGAFLFYHEGRRLLDFVQGWAVNALGHSPRIIRDALSAQAARLIQSGASIPNEPSRALGARLTRASGLARAFFTCTGAEANEGAVKLVRKWGKLHKGGAHVVVAATGSFHGRTLAMMAASGKPGFDSMYPPRIEGFRHAAFGDVDSLEALLDDEVVAIMLEPIQGEAGVRIPPAGYLGRVASLAKERGILLVLDEVQTGCGRTGTLFAFEQDGVVPDVLTLGKGLGGGLPLSALLCREEVACFVPGDQGGTFSNHPLLCAVGEAVVGELERPEFLARVRAAGERLERGLHDIASRHGGVVRARGLLQALDVAPLDVRQVAQTALAAGLIVNPIPPSTIRLMPRLDSTDEEIDEALTILGEAIARVAG
jgi:acetylornithine/N-succinyldiaminopimelate aminotransferase